MTSQQNNGGPAFPVARVVGVQGGMHCGSNGMTLRDYFAANVNGKDLDSLVPKSTEDICRFLGIPVSQFKVEVHYPMALAKARYMFSDAMLAQRSMGGNK